jgi:hypothetical protein
VAGSTKPTSEGEESAPPAAQRGEEITVVGMEFREVLIAHALEKLTVQCEYRGGGLLFRALLAMKSGYVLTFLDPNLFYDRHNYRQVAALYCPSIHPSLPSTAERQVFLSASRLGRGMFNELFSFVTVLVLGLTAGASVIMAVGGVACTEVRGGGAGTSVLTGNFLVPAL